MTLAISMTNRDAISVMTCLLTNEVALLVACRTNNRKVVVSTPAIVVCSTMLTGNRLG